MQVYKKKKKNTISYPFPFCTFIYFSHLDCETYGTFCDDPSGMGNYTCMPLPGPGQACVEDCALGYSCTPQGNGSSICMDIGDFAL